MPVSAQHMAVCKNLFLLCLKVVTVEGVVVGEQCVCGQSGNCRRQVTNCSVLQGLRDTGTVFQTHMSGERRKSLGGYSDNKDVR